MSVGTSRCAKQDLNQSPLSFNNDFKTISFSKVIEADYKRLNVVTLPAVSQDSFTGQIVPTLQQRISQKSLSLLQNWDQSDLTGNLTRVEDHVNLKVSQLHYQPVAV